MNIPQMNYNPAATVAATGPEGEKIFNRTAERMEFGVKRVSLWLAAIITLCIILKIIVEKLGTLSINKANNSAKIDLERVKCEEKAKLRENVKQKPNYMTQTTSRMSKNIERTD